VNDRKKCLRSQLRAEYARMSEIDRTEVDRGLIARLMGHDLYQKCERLFLYASFGSEINTHYLIEEAYRQGKTVALPKCSRFGIMDFYQYTGVLSEGKFHIPEPMGEESLLPNPNDIMIVPGLAFDVNGYRIGQGGGYYDRYLEKHPCIRIGLCRERFILKEIPIMWNDIPVDYVITENTVYCCKKNGAPEEAPFR